jgi:hypothetical protein
MRVVFAVDDHMQIPRGRRISVRAKPHKRVCWRISSAMLFWRLTSPDYGSDYRYSYVNGSLEHPFGLPGVRCDVCGQTWGGSRVLPYEYPELLRSHKKATDRWPISRSEHSALQEKLLNQLGLEGEPFVDLRPGDSFQPCYLDVPSRPRADFLWSSIGVLVVSERIKESFVSLCRHEIAVRPITLRKVGKRSQTRNANAEHW